MPQLEELVKRGLEEVHKLTNPFLKDILFYYFDVKKAKGMKRPELQSKIQECLLSMMAPMDVDDAHANTTENEANTN